MEGNNYRFSPDIQTRYKSTLYGQNGKFSVLGLIIGKPLQNLHICIVMKPYTIITERRETILRNIRRTPIGKVYFMYYINLYQARMDVNI